MKRRLPKYAVSLLAVYLVLIVGFFAAMVQPPAVFGHIMSRVGPMAYIPLPFETMWVYARRGDVKPGEMAPDFALQTANRTTEVRLSSFRGQEPVVLIFGSHT